MNQAASDLADRKAPKGCARQVVLMGQRAGTGRFAGHLLMGEHGYSRFVGLREVSEGRVTCAEQLRADWLT